MRAAWFGRTMHEARLTAARMLSPSVRELTFDPGPDFRFVAGQWVSFRIPLPGQEEIGRAYSIASPPRSDGTFEIAVTKVPTGPGSTYLHSIEPGTSLRMTHAQGFFTLNPVVRPVIMVATGTGVCPLRSMILDTDQDADREPDARFVLLFGVRTEEDILYRAQFETLASRWPGFSFVPSLSRGSDAWQGRRGYVQSHLAEWVHSVGGDCDVYVCGLNKMIREVRRVLKDELGFTRERIHTERYD
jgi:CDP-4-dehydro-6-deoxyglucose reductase, E3